MKTTIAKDLLLKHSDGNLSILRNSLYSLAMKDRIRDKMVFTKNIHWDIVRLCNNIHSQDVWRVLLDVGGDVPDFGEVLEGFKSKHKNVISKTIRWDGELND